MPDVTSSSTASPLSTHARSLFRTISSNSRLGLIHLLGAYCYHYTHERLPHLEHGAGMRPTTDWGYRLDIGGAAAKGPEGTPSITLNAAAISSSRSSGLTSPEYACAMNRPENLFFSSSVFACSIIGLIERRMMYSRTSAGIRLPVPSPTGTVGENRKYHHARSCIHIRKLASGKYQSYTAGAR